MRKRATPDALGALVLGSLMVLGVSQARAEGSGADVASAKDGALALEGSSVSFSDDGELLIQGRGAGEWFASIVSEQDVIEQAYQISLNDGCNNTKCVGSANTNGCTNGTCFATIEI